MDKYEYKIRSEEIKTLIAKGEYADAAAIADTIDWRRVKSVMMLCTISDLYKINRRFEDARDMLLLAYDRHPGGRSIVYSLCELCIKMDDFVPAVEYYKEFVQVAPKDSGRYVLQYKLYEAQDVSLEERIEVLEELKAKDYSEKWAYELAYLYHRIGLATKCVEECDELILWFGEGKYVLKAMELKQLHEPLTPEQQAKYEQIKGIRGEKPAETSNEQQTVYGQAEPDLADAPTKVIPQEELDIQVKLMGVGQYDTINMQKELAQNMKELWSGSSAEETAEQEKFHTEASEEFSASQDAADTESLDQPDEGSNEEPVEPEETKVEEVFFGETGEIDSAATQIMEEMKKEALGMAQKPDETVAEDASQPDASQETQGDNVQTDDKTLTATPAGDMTEWHIGEKPSGFEKILGMEYDGQISMVVPESEKVEKQITGQISLEDVLLEWEKMKKDSEQKRMEAVRQHVMQQTGAIFTEFEAATRDGLLEQLEKGNGIEEPEEAAEEAEEPESEELGEELGEEPEEELEEESGEEPEEESEEEPEEEEEAAEEAEESETEELGEEPEEELEEESGEEPEEEPEEELEEEEEAIEEEAEEAEESETEELEEEPEEELEEESGEEPEEEPVEEPEAEEEAIEEAEEEAEESETEELEEETGENGEENEEIEKEQDAEKKERRHDRGQKVRSLSPEERQLFGSYAQSRSTREQIVHAIDSISMAAYTGNVIITGEEGMDTLTLAKNLIKEVQQTDSNFSGKIAKISGDSLNRKGIEPVFGKLANGALIVQKAGGMTPEIIREMHRALNQENSGMIVILEDTPKSMHKLLKKNHILAECFNIEINVEALDNDSLVAYAKKYAGEQEYSIDELGILALHTRIAERQTSDHSVTISEVKEMVDNAIRHANRKSLGHFFDILVAKRYDEEDMIILREKDFM